MDRKTCKEPARLGDRNSARHAQVYDRDQPESQPVSTSSSNARKLPLSSHQHTGTLKPCLDSDPPSVGKVVVIRSVWVPDLENVPLLHRTDDGGGAKEDIESEGHPRDRKSAFGPPLDSFPSPSPSVSCDKAPEGDERPTSCKAGKRRCCCGVCGREFSSIQDLQRHRRETRTGAEGPWSCCLCETEYVNRAELTKHVRTHTRGKPYRCDVCEKAFRLKGNLTVHKLIHRGVRDHQCMVCGKEFVRSDHLTRHMWTHTGEKRFQCNVCGQAFTNKQTLTTHSRRHTGEKPYRCDVCMKAFRFSGDVKKHKRTHTGEKPHLCDVCGMAFRQSSSLALHRRTHTGEKPFSCKICSKVFFVHRNLEAHLLTHVAERSQELVTMLPANGETT